ncbi:MAG: hypothetical protein KGH64_00450 [Candidatus Micrarchaeota archaeon]|nr:hypothetical protein [Candidatus Micrarchaeota archaeon]MDE1833786.1 hypothetical protein [Candidatus Micrarchaeota archaeon]
MFPKTYNLAKNYGYLPSDTEKFVFTELSWSFKENVTVDINSERISSLYDAARKLTQAEIVNGRGKEESALLATLHVVHKQVPLESDRSLKETFRHFFYARKKPLDYFIENGAVCTHAALATLAILQRFRKDGYISGEIRMTGNRMLNTPGHAWANYEYPDSGRVMLLDSINNFKFLYKKSDLKTGTLERQYLTYTDEYGWDRQFDYFNNSGMVHDDFVARGIIVFAATLGALALGNAAFDGIAGYFAAVAGFVLTAPQAIRKSIYEKRVCDLTSTRRN